MRSSYILFVLAVVEMRELVVEKNVKNNLWVSEV